MAHHCGAISPTVFTTRIYELIWNWIKRNWPISHLATIDLSTIKSCVKDLDSFWSIKDGLLRARFWRFIFRWGVGKHVFFYILLFISFFLPLAIIKFQLKVTKSRITKPLYNNKLTFGHSTFLKILDV